MIESFGESFEEADRDEFVAEPVSTGKPRSKRERRLEVEVARLEAEIADLKGAGSVQATSQFLSLAARTIGVAMDEATREADRTRSEAAELTAVALAEVVEIRARTESEALALVSQRRDLDDHHAELRRRVEELAGSMVVFMTPEAAFHATAAADSPKSVPAATAEPSLVACVDPKFGGAPVLGTDPGATASEVRSDDVSTPSSIEELVEEQRFRDFIGGDVHDESRDWLLRHDRT